MNLLSLMDLHPDIFEDIEIPDMIDKDTMLNTIIVECATFDVMWHDYPLCKSVITNFFKMKYDQYDRMAAALAEKYDLIQNYDRTREYSRIVGRQNDGTDTNRVSAFDQSGFSDNDQTTSQGSSSEDETITEHEYGDLSSSTNTSKLKDELNLRRDPRYNLYVFIAQDFFDFFCLRTA